jgi:hypothetical protein
MRFNDDNLKPFKKGTSGRITTMATFVSTSYPTGH